MSFQSTPKSNVPEKEQCGEKYKEFDGREGAFTAICTKKKGHSGYHGWGGPK